MMKSEHGQIYLMECHGWYYIGVHCGDIVKDKYYGSGLAWNNIVKKYGKENVVRSIISSFNSRDEKQALEKKFIAHYRAIYGKKCVNISDGGDGGNLGEEVCRKISRSVSGEKNGMYGRKLDEETKRKISEALKGHPNYNPKGYRHTEEAKAKIRSAHEGVRHTEETKAKIREARRKQTNLVLTSAKGKHWYVSPNGTSELMLFHEDVPSGWTRGRIHQKNKGKIYYTNGSIDVLLYPTDTPPIGFLKGRHSKPSFTESRNRKISEKLKGRKVSMHTKSLLSKAIKGRHWYNNGIISRQAFECPKGWVKGKLSKKETV